MLTKVQLGGTLGRKFGRNWMLDCNSPAEALRLIDANKPGVLAWMRQNVKAYDRYHIVVENMDGSKEELSEATYTMERKARLIRITPIIAGAGAAARIIIGAVVTIIGVVLAVFSYGAATPMIAAGVSMMIGGIVELLSPRPKSSDGSQRSDKTSYYFNGPVNTTDQGVPVPLIYGRILVGSQAVSASVSIDQLM